MARTAGDPLPQVVLWTMGTDGPEVVDSSAVLGHGRVVLVAVPGAFTPGCSQRHLPGFVGRAADFAGRGVDLVACISVNDVWVMDAWARAQAVGDDVLMLADGNGEFAREMGLELDLTRRGLGVRSQRYAAVIEDGTIVSLEVDEPGRIEASACDAVLARL